MNELFITGIGRYLPRLSHTNETLPALDSPVTPADLAKIGVERRGWAAAGEGESIPEMAASAAREALSRASVGAADLDFIVLANWTQRRYIPEFAPKVKALLGAERAFAYDVSTACAGFVYGIAMAHAWLQNPRFHRGVVVAAETTSQRGRPRSKATLVFGDAAGAAVVERDVEHGIRLIDYELAVDGTQHHIMDISPEGWVRTHIEQRELVSLTSRCFRDVTNRLLDRHGLKISDVDRIVPHSGTAGVQAALVKTLEVPREKVLTNFSTVGNVSSAAIPVALHEFLASGQLKPGHLVLSPTVGTGFYSAALLLRIGA